MTLVPVPPILIKGVPCTLLTLNKLPILNGIDKLSIVFVVLGLLTSKTVVPDKSTSNPLTYALPGDNLTHIKSASGVLPSSVNLSSVNNPSLPLSSFNDSWRLTLNGSTE